MSAPDARLSAAERAALADIEAAAAAEDPYLAARLKGGVPVRALSVIASGLPTLRKTWAALVGAGWWGVAMAVAGLALMLVGVAVSLGLAVLGALVCLVGLRAIAEMLDRRLRRSGDAAPPS